MDTTLVLVGVALVAAAIVGGGLTIAGNTFGRIESRPRQVLLALLGVLVLAAGFGLIGAGTRGDGEEGTEEAGTTGTTASSVATTRPPTSVTFDPGGGAGEETVLSVRPGSGPPGTLVTLAGAGFAPGETVEVRFHVEIVARTTADGGGRFANLRVRVPDLGFRNQQFSFVATGRRSLRHAEEPFRVT